VLFKCQAATLLNLGIGSFFTIREYDDGLIDNSLHAQNMARNPFQHELI
jgi:hypothetical protein